MEHMFRAADCRQLPALVRVPNATTGWIAWALDAGAQGVVVPRVETEDDARQVVSAAYFFASWHARRWHRTGLVLWCSTANHRGACARAHQRDCANRNLHGRDECGKHCECAWYRRGLHRPIRPRAEPARLARVGAPQPGRRYRNNQGGLRRGGMLPRDFPS